MTTLGMKLTYEPPTTDIEEVKNKWRTCKTTKDRIENLPAKFKMLMGTIYINKNNEQQFVQELQNGTVQMGSNSSYYPNAKRGTHGYRLELHNGDIC